eukprot:Rmarinus@m.25016
MQQNKGKTLRTTYYRTQDPIDNLQIKVVLTKLSGSKTILQTRADKQPSVQTKLGWQEKRFSPGEVLRIRDSKTGNDAPEIPDLGAHRSHVRLSDPPTRSTMLRKYRRAVQRLDDDARARGDTGYYGSVICSRVHDDDPPSDMLEPRGIHRMCTSGLESRLALLEAEVHNRRPGETLPERLLRHLRAASSSKPVATEGGGGDGVVQPAGPAPSADTQADPIEGVYTKRGVATRMIIMAAVHVEDNPTQTDPSGSVGDEDSSSGESNSDDGGDDDDGSGGDSEGSSGKDDGEGQQAKGGGEGDRGSDNDGVAGKGDGKEGNRESDGVPEGEETGERGTTGGKKKGMRVRFGPLGRKGDASEGEMTPKKSRPKKKGRKEKISTSNEVDAHSAGSSLISPDGYVKASAADSGAQFAEKTLCCITFYSSGIVEARPAFSESSDDGYFFVMGGALYKYTIENTSEQLDDAHEAQERRAEASMHERTLALRQNLVGGEFTPPPPLRSLGVSVFGTLSAAVDFDAPAAYVEWATELPPGWSSTHEADCLAGCTQIATFRASSHFHPCVRGAQRVAHFCFPIELNLSYTPPPPEDPSVDHADASTDCPIIYFQVSNYDQWDRNTVLGYGYLMLPPTPGYCEAVVPTWVPEGSIRSQVRTFLIGGSVELQDASVSAVPGRDATLAKKHTLSKFGMRTKPGGSLLVNVSTVVQSSEVSAGDRGAEIMRRFGQRTRAATTQGRTLKRSVQDTSSILLRAKARISQYRLKAQQKPGADGTSGSANALDPKVGAASAIGSAAALMMKRARRPSAASKQAA